MVMVASLKRTLFLSSAAQSKVSDSMLGTTLPTFVSGLQVEYVCVDAGGGLYSCCCCCCCCVSSSDSRDLDETFLRKVLLLIEKKLFCLLVAFPVEVVENRVFFLPLICNSTDCEFHYKPTNALETI